MGLDRMDWMASRLQEIRRKPIELARHLNIQPPRVYEMIGGKRRMKSTEIAPAAAFLEWPVNVVMELVSGLKQPERVGSMVPTHSSSHPTALFDLPRNLPVRAAVPLAAARGGEFLLGTNFIDYVRRLPSLTNRTDVYCVYVQNETLMPWRKPGEPCICEGNRPPKEGDHVLIEKAKTRKLDGADANAQLENGTEAVIGLLLKSTPKESTIRHYRPEKDYTISRKDIGKMTRIMEWVEILT